MLIASIYARLAADPVARTTKTGKPMTTASVAVDVSGRDATGETLWVSVLAFGTQADALLRAGKGQMVAAMGRLSRGSYTAKDGARREQWTLLAESVVTARSARPIGRRQAANTKARSGGPGMVVFDDSLPILPATGGTGASTPPTLPKSRYKTSQV